MTVVNGHCTDKVELKFFFIGEEKVRLFFESKSLSVDEGSLEALQGSALTANCKHLKLVSTIQH